MGALETITFENKKLTVEELQNEAKKTLEDISSDKKLDGKDEAEIKKLQKIINLGEEFKGEKENIVKESKDKMKRMTLSMLKNGYTIDSPSDFRVLKTSLKISDIDYDLSGLSYEDLKNQISQSKVSSILGKHNADINDGFSIIYDENHKEYDGSKLYVYADIDLGKSDGIGTISKDGKFKAINGRRDLYGDKNDYTFNNNDIREGYGVIADALGEGSYAILNAVPGITITGKLGEHPTPEESEKNGITGNLAKGVVDGILDMGDTFEKMFTNQESRDAFIDLLTSGHFIKTVVDGILQDFKNLGSGDAYITGKAIPAVLANIIAAGKAVQITGKMFKNAARKAAKKTVKKGKNVVPTEKNIPTKSTGKNISTNKKTTFSEKSNKSSNIEYTNSKRAQKLQDRIKLGKEQLKKETDPKIIEGLKNEIKIAEQKLKNLELKTKIPKGQEITTPKKDLLRKPKDDGIIDVEIIPKEKQISYKPTKDLIEAKTKLTTEIKTIKTEIKALTPKKQAGLKGAKPKKTPKKSKELKTKEKELKKIEGELSKINNEIKKNSPKNKENKVKNSVTETSAKKLSANTKAKPKLITNKTAKQLEYKKITPDNAKSKINDIFSSIKNTKIDLSKLGINQKLSMAKKALTNTRNKIKDFYKKYGKDSLIIGGLTIANLNNQINKEIQKKYELSDEEMTNILSEPKIDGTGDSTSEKIENNDIGYNIDKLNSGDTKLKELLEGSKLEEKDGKIYYIVNGHNFYFTKSRNPKMTKNLTNGEGKDNALPNKSGASTSLKQWINSKNEQMKKGLV